MKSAMQAVIGFVTATVFCAHGAELIRLGDLPGNTFYSRAIGVSGDGATVAMVGVGPVGQVACYWTEEHGIQPLGELPGKPNSWSQGISGDGSAIVGRASSSTESDGFLWTESTGMVAVDDLPGGSNVVSVYGAADGGRYLAGSWVPQGIGSKQAFYWDMQGEIVGLGNTTTTLPENCLSRDGSTVVGGHAGHAFRWTADGGLELMPHPSGFDSSFAMGVSDDGSVVVGRIDNSTSSQGFRWTSDGGVELLGEVADRQTVAHAVSADGSVIVGYSDELYAVMWDETNGWRALADVLTNDYGLDLQGFGFRYANGISSDGRTIVGDGHADEGYLVRLGAPPPPGDANGSGLTASARAWPDGGMATSTPT